MKILLIEDDQHTSELIAETLLSNRYAVDAIADGGVGLEMATQWEYDLIILDILLPKLDGIAVCRKLRDRGCQTPILILTAKVSNEDIVVGLDAGADDYLTKPCNLSQLLARVRALLRRRSSILPPPILTWGLLQLDPVGARVNYNQNEIAVRPKEYALLELFLRNPNRVLSRSSIIDHLWPTDDTPVEGSITNLIKDLRQRLRGAGMLEDLIETVYGIGYRLKSAPANVQSGQSQPANHGGACKANQKISTLTSMLNGNDWTNREHPAKARFQQITERFQQSLKQRIATLEAMERSLQTGCYSLEDRQAALAEAHKLAGGLGTFGCSQASQIAHTIEHLLESNLKQETTLMNQLPQLLRKLKRELAHSFTDTTIA